MSVVKEQWHSLRNFADNFQPELMDVVISAGDCCSCCLRQKQHKARRRMEMVGKHKVEFDARRKVAKKVPVKFKTEAGASISFKAKKKVEKPVHVKFMAKNK
jgi:hypothetical protein